jgi:sarcosine oxidase
VSSPYEIAVVGSGPIGSAALRYVAAQSDSVVGIGAAEPAHATDTDGPFAGHYDSTRTNHALESSFFAVLFAQRSARRYASLAEATETRFFRHHASFMVAPDDLAAVIADGHLRQREAEWYLNYLDLGRMVANATDCGVAVEVLPSERLTDVHPALRIPAGSTAVLQRDAMLVNPRKLVSAQLAMAVEQGATVVQGEVVGLVPSANSVSLVLRTGEAVTAKRVVLAVGGYTNLYNFLRSPVATETVGLMTYLMEADPARADFPIMCGMYRDPSSPTGTYSGTIYPAEQYPDGRWYVKALGSAGRKPRVLLDTREAATAWFHDANDADDRDGIVGMVDSMLPDLGLRIATRKSCLMEVGPVTAPFIDFVDDRVVVACNAQGWGVMGSDEIGRLAAGLAATGTWIDPLPAETFSAVSVD